MMKKIVRISLILISIIFSVLVIFYIYSPFAKSFIDEKVTVGDSLMHLANIVSIQRDYSFPIMSWRTEWGGYPLIEGYPWLNYYFIQPILPFFSNSGIAMDYYSAFFLFIYYVFAFLLFAYVSRNIFLALFFTIVLIYGADSQMPFAVNSFMTFTASQFYLPLILLVTIIARKRNSKKIFLLSAILLSIAFYSHGSMTGIVILPLLFPFLILDNLGRLSKETILNTIRFFTVFTLLSAVQIYQFIDYNRQGYLRGVKPFPLEIIPERFMDLTSWFNPVLLLLVIFFIPFFIIAVRKNVGNIRAYFFSFLFILFIFSLMLFNITSMNLVLLAERVLWGISLSFLLLFSKIISKLGYDARKQVIIGVISSVLITGYLFLTLVAKPLHLVPNTLRAYDQYYYKSDGSEDIKPDLSKYKTKFDLVYSYPPLSWMKSFDNYRTDGLSYSIYSNWNIWSSNTRYKGRFPAAKGLPLDWSGLVSAAEYGKLGEGGTVDTSTQAVNQSIFFFDWYGIKHFEIADSDFELAAFLRKEPYITNTDRRHIKGADKSLDLIYHNIDKKYVGPMYAPTNAKTIAVVSEETQYDNFIRTISYSEFTSQKLIPVYLGSSLNSLNKDNLKYFDAVFLYGYKKPLFRPANWSVLSDYVKEGGKLIIETGQKVSETESISLPDVFPMQETRMTVVDKSFNVELKDTELIKNVKEADFAPLNTKYLPYSISETDQNSLRSWAKPVLLKDGKVILAYGVLGKGNVIWSGLNLPFHAIDNKNISEIKVFENILDLFFPDKVEQLEDFKVEHPTPEKIAVSAFQGKGFLIKENYNPGWNAKLNGKKVKIYKAGLFQMYVPFEDLGKEQTVELIYLGNPLHWVLFAVAFISFILVIIYLIFEKHPLFLLNKKFPKIRLMKSEDEDY